MKDGDVMPLEMILLNIIFFMSVFLLIFIIDFYIVSKEKVKNRKIEKMTSQDLYIIKKFDLDDKLINLRQLNFHISIINSFIISFVSTIICITDFHISLQIAISFVLLFGLIYSLYEIYGRYLQKKIGKKNK